MASSLKSLKDLVKMKVMAVLAASFALLASVLATPPAPKTASFQQGSINTVYGLTSTLSHGVAVTTLAQHCNDKGIYCMPNNNHQYRKCMHGFWVVYECPFQTEGVHQQFVCVLKGNGEDECELPLRASSLKTGLIAATSLSVHQSVETRQAVVTMGCSPSTYKGKCLSKDLYLTCYKGNVVKAACSSGNECQMLNGQPYCRQIPVTYAPVHCDRNEPWSCVDKNTMQYCPSSGLDPRIKTCSGNQICKDKLGCVIPGDEDKFKPLSGTCKNEGWVCKDNVCAQKPIDYPSGYVPPTKPSTSLSNIGQSTTPTINIVQSVILQTKVLTHTVAESTAVVTYSKMNNCPAEYQCVHPGQGRQFKKCVNGEMVPFNCSDTSICINWVNYSGTQWLGIECILEIAGVKTSPSTIHSTTTQRLATIGSGASYIHMKSNGKSDEATSLFEESSEFQQKDSQ
ncbi:hypothetical protein K493DRAFT_296931 [Basidiobolus meristosporus CBS 931.73]|uniref:Carbohydrate-binding module family 19 domain-containing protein n=1 Tax=Basidiobolus meristosporus CBS 931.73 TaxID=1314790 RepID=A0A1Y1Z2G9_9FUNG|nr:hypothetical protein K493DRAFT_296931 [Basidiobolus meristosporus CBS 931.73]|eukprot:ORY04490.1 hypothetical protein K493DRAFT_296931 [Basidiobolus meristosporus CBS 931.73]